MIAEVKSSASQGYWAASEPAPDAEKTPARAVTEATMRRPYDWSNIVFAVDYCRQSNRDYEDAAS